MLRLEVLAAGRSPRPDEDFPRWLFLGKDPAREAACEAALPAERRVDAAARLQTIADRLRGPFASEVARLGREQDDLRGWLSSAFAWKTHVASDLFLLSCYRLLIRELAAEHGAPVRVILDDPWLYEDCRRDAAAPPVSLRAPKLRLALRAVAARGLWLGRSALSWARQKMYSRGRAAVFGKPTYAVGSVPEPFCFDAGPGWRDPYMPGVEALVARLGASVLRFSPPDAWGFEKELAARPELVRPLILEAGPLDLLAAAAAFWRPRALSSFALEGVAMPALAGREWWTDASGARWCSFKLFDVCFRRFLEREKPAAVVYLYENQPWEKLLCAACAESGTATVGYQHSVVARSYMGYWPGPEGPGTPLPDHILASGPSQKEFMIEAGTPAAKLKVGGSMRFRYLAAGQDKPRPRRAGARVLVVGTYEPGITRSLLEAVRAAFPDGGKKDGLELCFRSHPAAPPGSPREVAGMASVAGDLSAQLRDFNLVVGTGSTAALEARFLGVPVVLFRPAAVLDAADPGNLVPDGFFDYATAPELRRKILERLKEPGGAALDSARLRDAIFAPVDEEVWLGCLRK